MHKKEIMNQGILNLFYFDSLSTIMLALICSIAAIIMLFSRRFMIGDTRYKQFFTTLALLSIALCILVSADHMLLFFIAWIISNCLLVSLMIHKSDWRAARASGILTIKIFGVGFLCLGLSFFMLFNEYQQSSIQAIIKTSSNSSSILPLLLLFLAAATQSALWPFHRWLLSSLNSPTPVSAFMHAGLINGGGFLLARFAPLFKTSPAFFTLMFIIGSITALMGTFFKLLQSSIKRMLACSTMSQMGFMMVQCGLGLFPAAIAHLCWHGMFKAYLFLSSGSAAQKKRFNLGYPPSALSFILALICGLLGSYAFALASDKQWLATDSTLVLIFIALIGASQSALPLLKNHPIKKFPITLIFTGILGLLYGLNVYIIEWFLEPLAIHYPQPLNLFHWLMMFITVSAWLYLLLFSQKNQSISHYAARLYVAGINASRPDSTTITAYHNDYSYKN